jgi:hypothetical protein
MAADKLTAAQAGKLGGLRAAHVMGADGLARAGSKGGRATLENKGREHYSRIAHQRWGRLKKGIGDG